VNGTLRDSESLNVPFTDLSYFQSTCGLR
jgi:hypothetical protein